MSQQLSQTSNCSLEPMLSQDTFDQVFSNIHGIFPNQQDLNRIQSECRLAPTAIELTDENLHENVEMRLDYVGVVSRPEPEFLPFLQDNSFRSDFKQESTGFKQEPENLDNSFIQSTIATPPPEQSMPQPLIVCNTDFPGMYGFDLYFEEEKSPPTKSAQWTYSPSLKKLFVKMRCIVPLRVKLQVFPPVPAPGFYVRVVVIYRQPDHYREIIERCPNHITKQKDGHHAPNHLLRCEDPRTQYMTCPETGRHSLRIPLDTPQAGSDFVTNMFQFMCFSSCPGGLNRRPILVIFTLEYDNMVLGRKAQNVRICACPGRDRTNEEIAETKRQAKSSINRAAPSADPQVQTSTPNETPPPTPQASAAPHTPPERATTSTGAEETGTSQVQVPKLTKKRSHSFISSGFEVKSVSLDRNRLKRIKAQEADEEVFTIQVKGREKYEMLLKIKEGLDIMDMVPQVQMDKYRASCPPCGKLRSSRTSQNNSQNSDPQNSQNSNSQILILKPPQILSKMNWMVLHPLTQLSRSDSAPRTSLPPHPSRALEEGLGSMLCDLL
ncbi:Tumor protein 63 [Desmophyllum pertusum]|uniref:Tumor protein 63 n=1 Tax=Desmophyllum pertusum TaxID=174260 RepID=A0A9X0A4R6_9CNID|nr:Tumor protein 63 [Desmophyllum pertusum]